jgi:hypothetical protein
MGLFGDMLAGGLAGGAKFMGDDIEKEIAMQRQQALEEARATRGEQIRREGAQFDHEQKIKNAPELAEAEMSIKEKMAPRETAIATGKKDAELSWTSKNAGLLGQAEAAKETGKINAPGWLAAQAKVKAVGDDPNSRALTKINLEKAQIELERIKKGDLTPAQLSQNITVAQKIIDSTDSSEDDKATARSLMTSSAAALQTKMATPGGDDLKSKFPPKPKADQPTPPAPVVEPPPAPAKANDVVRMEKNSDGSFIEFLSNGSRRRVTGDDAERRYILMK